MLTWPKFTKMIQDLGYRGDGTSLDDVTGWLKKNGHDAEVVHDGTTGDEHDIRDLYDGGAAMEAEVAKQMDALERATGTGKHKPKDTGTGIVHRHDISPAGRGGGNLQRQGYGRNDDGPYEWKVWQPKTRRELEADGLDTLDNGGFGEGDDCTALRRLGGLENASLVDYFRCTIKAGQGNSKAQDKLAPYDVDNMKAQGEAIDSDGGFIAPAQIADNIQASVLDMAPWMTRITRIQINRRSIDMARLDDRDRSSQEIASFALANVAEAGTIADDTIKFGLSSMVLHKAAKLVYLSNELLSDSVPNAGLVVRDVIASAVQLKMAEDIIRGNGAGQPLGILNGGGAFTLAARDTASLVDYQADWLAMLARMEPGLLGNAIALAHISLVGELGTFNVTRGTDGISLVGPTTVTAAGTPQMTLPPFGTPLFFTEACSSLNVVGDLILWDPRSYIWIESAGGPVIDSSPHLRFSTDQETLRIRHRRNGQLWRGQTLKDSRNYEVAQVVLLPAG